eukprot:291101_1
MSHTHFTSPIANNKDNKHNSNTEYQHNLCGLLETRLNQHNNDKMDNFSMFENNNNMLQMKRRLSIGDKIPTPYNSPAIKNNTIQSHMHVNACNNKRLSGLVSPLNLTNTPPVTPDQNYFRNPKVKINQSIRVGCLSPDARAMVITESSHMHKPSNFFLANSQDIEFKDDHGLQTCQKRLRSLSCSETNMVKKTKIMSPRLSAVPSCPGLKPVSNAIRRNSFDDPEPLIIPPSPKDPQFVSPHYAQFFKEDAPSPRFNDLQTCSDILMDD